MKNRTRTAVGLFGAKAKSEDEQVTRGAARRLAEKVLGDKPASFYFMVVTLVLLLLNLYVTRSSGRIADVHVTYGSSTSTPGLRSSSGAAEATPFDTGSAEQAEGPTEYGEEDREALRQRLAQEDDDDEEGDQHDQEHDNADAYPEQSLRDSDAAVLADLGSTRSAASIEEALSRPFPNLVDMSDEELFENFAELEAAPTVFVPSIPQKRNEWWGVQEYVRMYQKHPIKRFVPILRAHIQINQETFTQRFRKVAQPLLFRMDNLRKAGFTTHAWTFDELREMFPFDKTMEGKTFSQYRPNAKIDSNEIDLGPGLAAISTDGQIVRKNGLRNFPRNMKVKTEALRKLGVQWPPLIPSRWRQRPSLWMGTSTSGTAFHSDCCDNFISMIAGTKRLTLAPPSDFHLLSPRCVGKNKGLCYANIPEPNKPGVSSAHYNKMIVDVKPGEILWMPAGWFHHIENLGPTLMYNTWSFGEQTAGVTSCNKKWST